MQIPIHLYYQPESHSQQGLQLQAFPLLSDDRSAAVYLLYLSLHLLHSLLVVPLLQLQLEMMMRRRSHGQGALTLMMMMIQRLIDMILAPLAVAIASSTFVVDL